MLRLLLVGSVLALGLVTSVWSRFAALLTYVWFALFRPQEWLYTSVTDLRLSLVIGLLLLVPSLLTGTFPNLTHPLSIGTLAFMATAGLAQLATAHPELSWPWLDGFIRLSLVVLLSINILNTRRRIVLFIAVLSASIGFHTSKGGLSAIIGGASRFAEGLGGAFIDNNGYAMAAAMILPLLICVAQNLDRQRRAERVARVVFLAGVPLSILMIVGTMSRAGFLATAAAVLTFIALQRQRLVPLVAVIAVVVVGLPFAPVPAGYFERLQTIRTYEETNETSALSRLHFWRVAVRMVADNPLGVGMRNYDHVYDNYDFSGGEFGSARSVHSSHFQVLAEQGYLGLLVWIAMFACAFTMAWRIRAFGQKMTGLTPDEARFYLTTGNALIVSMVTFLVGGAFIALANNDITWYTFGVVAATDRLMRARRRELEPRLTITPSSAIVMPVRRRATA